MIHLVLTLFFEFVCTEKRKTKIIFNFNHLKDIDRIFQDFDLSSFEIKNVSLNYNIEDLGRIPLNSNTLCIILNNLKLLEENEKIPDVVIDKLAITKENEDVWGKLKFNDDRTDKTGYFKGIVTDNFEIRKDLFFHPKNTDEKIIEKNTQNIFKLVSYIGILKKLSLAELYKKECNLSLLDLIIFNNFYIWKEKKETKVCVCKESGCIECDENFKMTKSEVLRVH